MLDAPTKLGTRRKRGSTATKVQLGIQVTVAALLLVWPLAQFALHRRVQNDPWKLGGWAMYTIPRPQFRVSLVTGDKTLSRISGCELEVEQYVQRRAAFGTLTDPSPLVSCLKARAGVDRTSSLRIRQRLFDAHQARYETLVETLRL